MVKLQHFARPEAKTEPPEAVVELYLVLQILARSWPSLQKTKSAHAELVRRTFFLFDRVSSSPVDGVDISIYIYKFLLGVRTFHAMARGPKLSLAVSLALQALSEAKGSASCSRRGRVLASTVGEFETGI